MQIAKGNLELVFLLLKGTEGKISLAESRIRDAAMKEIIPLNETFVTDRKKIFETFCDKEEDGSLKYKTTVNEKGEEIKSYTFPPENNESLVKELETLLKEEVTITGDLKPIMAKTEYQPKVGEAEIIDNILK